MTYINLPTEALDYARMLATTPGTQPTAPSPPTADTTMAQPAAPPPYTPPPLNLESAKDSWLNRAMQIIGAAGSRIDPSAFHRAKDRRSASIIAALMAGTGAAGTLRQQSADEDVKLRNEETLQKWKGQEEAARQTAVAGSTTNAIQAARQPYDIAKEQRDFANMLSAKTIDYENAVKEHKANAMFDTSQIGPRIDAETEARIRNRLLAMRDSGYMTPEEAAQFDINKAMLGMKQVSERYNQLVPTDVTQQLNLMRQMEADLRRNIMSIPAQSRDREMLAQVEQMKVQADGIRRQRELLQKAALESGEMQIQQNVPEEDRPAMRVILHGMFSDEGQTQARIADAMSSPVADDVTWKSMKQDQRLQALRGEFGKAMQTDDIGSLVTYWNSLKKRMDEGYKNNSEMRELMSKFYAKVMMRQAQASKPQAMPAHTDTTHTLTDKLMNDSEPGFDEEAK